MKAVIVECSNGAAVALCDDGTFRKLKNKSYSIGQELFIKEKASPNRMMQKLSICASLALVLLSFVGIGSYSYVRPYSYVSLDINPSIEYALNRYDKVISVSGINNEGQQVVSSIESDIKNQNITTALGVTIRQLEKDNYILEEAYNHVIVSVCSTNHTKAQSIASRVDTFSAEESHVCSIDTVTVSKEVKDNADSLGITPGKLALINAVAETTSDADFDIAEWTDKTVSELETTIQQASAQLPGSEQGPASETVINSEYLSSVLDDNPLLNSDSTATSSAMKVGEENGSDTADKQTDTANDTTAGVDTSESASTSKPDSNISTASSDSTSKAEDTGSTAKSDTPDTTENADNTAADTDNSGLADQDTSTKNPDKNASSNKGNSDKGSSSSKDSESSNKNSGSTSKGSSSNSSSKNDEDDTLTEESSSKKDSYPVSDTDTMEDSSNLPETDVKPDFADSTEPDVASTANAAATELDANAVPTADKITAD